MKAHLSYLRYVLLHKLYVLRAGLLLGPSPALPFPAYTRWIWRLLVHDLSKFGRAEWGPYVAMFYGPTPPPPPPGTVTTDSFLRDRQARFNAAWLHHIHVNPHHWQHWLLHEDSGKTLVLVPPPWIADEMVADWIGAGSKVLRSPRPTMAQCVVETIEWYAANRDRMQLRLPVQTHVEARLIELADRFGIRDAAHRARAASQARAALTLPGRP